MGNERLGVKVSIGGSEWDIIKQGIIFPLLTADEGADNPELTIAKIDGFETGKRLFLKSVEVMAMSVLRDIPSDAKGIIVSLIVEKDV